MRRVWLKMRMDAESCTNYLEEDLPEALATPLLGLGSGSVNGSTRSKVVEVMEQLHAKVLSKVLEGVRPKSTRAAWAWKSCTHGHQPPSSSSLTCLPR